MEEIVRRVFLDVIPIMQVEAPGDDTINLEYSFYYIYPCYPYNAKNVTYCELNLVIIDDLD